MTELDVYQERYLAHQSRKREVLSQLLAERHSERAYADMPLAHPMIAEVTNALYTAPSSCDRRALSLCIVDDRDGLALLGGLLVGGVGWVHRAPVVALIFADAAAYKAGTEVDYMPFLDAGVLVGHMYLSAQAAGLRGCYINPNIRESNRAYFDERFAGGNPNLLYCGAFAFGFPRNVTPEWVIETS